MSEPSPVTYTTADAGNRSAGDILRLARESQRLTLDQLAAAIKVSPVKLAALESGALDQLPDANFARALAMAVCRSLKIDAASVLAGLPAARAMPLHAEKPPLNQPFKDSRRTSPLFDQPWALGSLLSLKWLAPLALLLAALAVYFLPDSVELPAWAHLGGVSAASQSASEPEAPASVPEVLEAPSQPASVTPMPPSSAASSLSPTLTLDTGTDAAASGASAADGVASVSADGGLAPVAVLGHDLVLTIAESSWVDVRDGAGAKLVSRHADVGEVLTLQGRAPLKLRIGNASGVKATYSGKALDLVPFTRNNVARLELK